MTLTAIWVSDGDVGIRSSPQPTLWKGEGREVWLFFDNDEAGFAVEDARRILAMLGP